MQANRKEWKDQVFRKYIKKNAQSIKGVSIINEREDSEKERVFDVELVYVDRNDLQTISLKKTNKGWKINNISTPVKIKPAIPYFEQVIGKKP